MSFVCVFCLWLINKFCQQTYSLPGICWYLLHNIILFFYSSTFILLNYIVELVNKDLIIYYYSDFQSCFQERREEKPPPLNTSSKQLAPPEPWACGHADAAIDHYAIVLFTSSASFFAKYPVVNTHLVQNSATHPPFLFNSDGKIHRWLIQDEFFNICLF